MCVIHCHFSTTRTSIFFHCSRCHQNYHMVLRIMMFHAAYIVCYGCLANLNIKLHETFASLGFRICHQFSEPLLHNVLKITLWKVAWSNNFIDIVGDYCGLPSRTSSHKFSSSNTPPEGCSSFRIPARANNLTFDHLYFTGMCMS